jgi:Acyl-CoA dehydrogenase, N-terminal domain
MDLADFVPPAMLPMPLQNANSSLSQRVSRLSAARRDRGNPEPGIIWVFKSQSSAAVVLAYQKTKGVYIEAYKAGIAMAMLPKEYGGGGLSCLDFVIAAEEICAVDPGFACTVLCNGLGLMPVSWYGSEEQKKRFIGAATSDPTGTYLSAWTAGEPPGGTGGTANFDSPLPKAGIGMTAVRDGDYFVLKRQEEMVLFGRLGRTRHQYPDGDHPYRHQRRRHGGTVGYRD